MPLDGPLSLQLSLPEILGIRPIEEAVLEKHTADQLRKYRPSLAYRCREHIRYLMSVALLVAFASMILAAATTVGAAVTVFFKPDEFPQFVTVLLDCGVVWWGAFCILLCMGPLSRIKLREGAVWSERELRTLYKTEMPEAVRNLAVQAHAFGATLEIGELFRKTELLDPYLIARFGDQRYVLAIWEGDEVLHIAKPIADPDESP